MKEVVFQEVSEVWEVGRFSFWKEKANTWKQLCGSES